LASAFVHHRRDEIGEPFLAGIVLARAAAEGEADGDQRIGVTLDEPGLDAAGAYDAFDFHAVTLSSLSCGENERCGCQHRALPQQKGREPEAHLRARLRLAFT